MIKKYLKKPRAIKAIKIIDDESFCMAFEWAKWEGFANAYNVRHDGWNFVSYDAPDKVLKFINRGDYLVKDEDGKFFISPSCEFESKHEEIHDDETNWDE